MFFDMTFDHESASHPSALPTDHSMAGLVPLDSDSTRATGIAPASSPTLPDISN